MSAPISSYCEFCNQVTEVKVKKEREICRECKHTRLSPKAWATLTKMVLTRIEEKLKRTDAYDNLPALEDLNITKDTPGNN